MNAGHAYLGYVLRIDGVIGAETRSALVAIGEAAHAKHQFRVSGHVSGTGHPVADSRREIAELYKVSRLTVASGGEDSILASPPWLGVCPELSTYRERGHRRLAARTYQTKCMSCIWGCRMPVDLIIDPWNPDQRRYRMETFCYGPLSCRLYKAGPTRKVPGRRGMSYEEEDWVDGDVTSHRLPDE